MPHDAQVIVRLLAMLCFACPAFAGELEDMKAEFHKHDHEMKAVLKDLKQCLRARPLVLVENDQEDWLRYREGMSEFQARGKEPELSEERWQTAGHLTESRVAWLKAWKLADKRKGWSGKYIDSYGGCLRIVEKDGQHYFHISVVRGPTFHNGGIGGLLKIEKDKASYEVRAMPEDEPTIITISQAGDGSGRLKVDGKNTGYFHGARAYFQGLYLWTGELSKQEKAELFAQLEDSELP